MLSLRGTSAQHNAPTAHFLALDRLLCRDLWRLFMYLVTRNSSQEAAARCFSLIIFHTR